MRQRAKGEIEYLPLEVTFHHRLLLHIVTEHPIPVASCKRPRHEQVCCNNGFRILRATCDGNRGDMAISCGTNSPPCPCSPTFHVFTPRSAVKALAEIVVTWKRSDIDAAYAWDPVSREIVANGGHRCLIPRFR